MRPDSFLILSRFLLGLLPAISLMEQMRLVLGTAAIAPAIRSDSGASRRLLLAALQGESVTLLVSLPCDRVRGGHARPEHLSAAGLTAAEVGTALDALAAVAKPQTPAKAGRLREKRVRGGPARVRAMSLQQRSRVSRAWRTTFPTVLSSRKRSRLGLALCNSSGRLTRL